MFQAQFLKRYGNKIVPFSILTYYLKISKSLSQSQRVEFLLRQSSPRQLKAIIDNGTVDIQKINDLYKTNGSKPNGFMTRMFKKMHRFDAVLNKNQT